MTTALLQKFGLKLLYNRLCNQGFVAMSQPYTIQHQGKITSITLKGEVNNTLLKSIAEELWQGKDYHHPCELWDLRTCIVAIGPQEIKELSQFVSAQKEGRGYGRVAIVVERDLHFKLSQLYEHHTQNLPFEVKAFRDIDIAREWLLDSA